MTVVVVVNARTIGHGQPDAVAVHPIDSADMYPIGSHNVCILFDKCGVDHIVFV